MRADALHQWAKEHGIVLDNSGAHTICPDCNEGRVPGARAGKDRKCKTCAGKGRHYLSNLKGETALVFGHE